MDRRERKRELERRERELDEAMTLVLEVMLFSCQALQRVKLELRRANTRKEVQEEMDRLYLRALVNESELTRIAQRWMQSKIHVGKPDGNEPSCGTTQP